MGSATKTTGGDFKKRRQQQQLRPKNSIRKNRTQDKNPPKKTKDKKKKKSSDEHKNTINSKAPKAARKREVAVAQWATASQQLRYFINQYESANRVQLSSLELDSLQEKGMIELGQGPAQKIAGNLGEHVKVAFGSSWKEVLCGKNLKEGQVDPGCPALLVISSSALRSLELIRELRSLTKECHAAKLFSKHMKVEEQVSILKDRVNIACGTPSRIKKLIDMEALELSRLAVIVFDMHPDAKGYSLFTLPQVRDELWDLYKSYFHQPLLESNLRLCLYGPVPINLEEKKSELGDD